MSSRNPSAQYSFRDAAATMGGRFGGQYITNDTVDTYTLPWGGVATVRLLPTRLPPDPASPGVRLSPFRHSQDVNDVGDWIRCYHGVRNFGAGLDGGGVSFLINDPTDPTAAPKEESPAYVLFNAVDRAVRAGQEGRGWAALLRGGQNKGPQLSRPKPIYVANALIMQNKEVVYNPPQGWVDSKPKIMIMSDSAGQALMNLANGIREDADPHDTDWSRVSTCGNLVGLESGQGQYVTFYKSTEGDPRLRRQAATQGGVQLANFGSAQGGAGAAQGTGFATYNAFAEPVFMGQSADFSHMAHLLVPKLIQWDQVLNFPTYEQQAHWIADKFEPDVICYAFQDYPEWIPARVLAANVARTQQAGSMMPIGGFVGGYVPPVQPTGGAVQAAGWGAAPAQATSLGGQAYIQTAVNNAAAMVAAQQQTATNVPATAASIEAVPFITDALSPDTVSPQLTAQQLAEQQAMFAAQQAAAQQAAAQQAAAQQAAAQHAAAQHAAAQQAAAQQAAAQQAAAQQAAYLQAMAAQQQATSQPGAVAANWGTSPANAAVAPQTGPGMAGLAAGGIPVAVTQATVAASNVSQQPGAGFAMPTTMAPAAAPAATGQPLSRSQAALLAAQQAAQAQ